MPHIQWVARQNKLEIPNDERYASQTLGWSSRFIPGFLVYYEQSLTHFNGDGGEHSLPEKRRVEGQKW